MLRYALPSALACAGPSAGASLSSDSGVLAAVDVDLNRTSVSVDNDGIMRRQYVNVSLMIGGMFYRTRAIHSS